MHCPPNRQRQQYHRAYQTGGRAEQGGVGREARRSRRAAPNGWDASLCRCGEGEIRLAALESACSGATNGAGETAGTHHSESRIPTRPGRPLPRPIQHIPAASTPLPPVLPTRTNVTLTANPSTCWPHHAEHHIAQRADANASTALGVGKSAKTVAAVLATCLTSL